MKQLLVLLTICALAATVSGATLRSSFKWFSAVFEKGAPGSNGVEGSVTFTNQCRSSVVFTEVQMFKGLSAKNGAYAYHVHQKPVPKNGDCAGTGDHIDQETAPNTFDCSKEKDKSKCQAGDLSGKFGKMAPVEKNGKTIFVDAYPDSFLKMDSSTKGIVGRSVVIHDNTGKRIACASIVEEKTKK